MSSYLPIKYVEWRGVEGLVAAEVLQDDKDGYVTGNVFAVAGVTQIEKSTESASGAKYYDNIPALVVMGESVDTLTINASAIPLDVLAYITGNYYDPDTGAMVTGNGETKIFALGYKTQKTGHEDVYVWRYRGVFNANDVTHITENNSTDANGQTITYTGYETRYVFEKTGRRAKALNVDVSMGRADVGSFFNQVMTPDTLEPIEGDDIFKLIASGELHYQFIGENVSIDFGDGTTTTETETSIARTKVHTFADDKDYIVTFSGGISRLRFAGSINPAYNGIKEVLTPLPRGMTSVQGLFEYCSELKTVPADLFKYNRGLTSYAYLFDNSGLEVIPRGLFAGCTNALTFRDCFWATKITTIPADLFADSINATSMNRVFGACKSLLSIPSDLFCNNPNVNDFQYAFVYAYSLESIPITLFDPCQNVKNFNWIFVATNASGVAPALWERTNVENHEAAFRNASNLSNYYAIPADWK